MKTPKKIWKLSREKDRIGENTERIDGEEKEPKDGFI